jgi:predicted TIM-barrel fold metal-dependent hydrolase
MVVEKGVEMDYQLFDADNHYYEPEDAFTRYGDDQVKRFVRWESEGKRRHLLFGNTAQTMVPNPTFNPIAKPGAFHGRLKELAEGGERGIPTMTDPSRYGELEPLPEHYQDRSARLRVMDEQHLERAFLFPTLAVGVEGINPVEVPMTYKVFRAFNDWLDDDWGFAHDERLYAAPAIPVLDPVLATEELDRVLAQGARLVTLRPGPANGRSPADPSWDPFWARLQESGVPAAYHAYGGTDQYADAFRLLWQRHGISDRAYDANLQQAWVGDRPMLDTALALVLGNLFGRFPRLRILSIELGCAWVPYCMHVLDHSGGLLDRNIRAFGETIHERPSEVFRRHFWVSPFPEEDIAGLIGLIGADRVLFGSDWPHAEGTQQPADYARYLEKLDAADARKVMRDNALSLVGAT